MFLTMTAAFSIVGTHASKDDVSKIDLLEFRRRLRMRKASRSEDAKYRFVWDGPNGGKYRFEEPHIFRHKMQGLIDGMELPDMCLQMKIPLLTRAIKDQAKDRDTAELMKKELVSYQHEIFNRVWPQGITTVADFTTNLEDATGANRYQWRGKCGEAIYEAEKIFRRKMGDYLSDNPRLPQLCMRLKIPLVTAALKSAKNEADRKKMQGILVRFLFRQYGRKLQEPVYEVHRAPAQPKLEFGESLTTHDIDDRAFAKATERNGRTHRRLNSTERVLRRLLQGERRRV